MEGELILGLKLLMESQIISLMSEQKFKIANERFYAANEKKILNILRD